MPVWEDFISTPNEVDDDDLPLPKHRLYDDDGNLRPLPSSTSPSTALPTCPSFHPSSSNTARSSRASHPCVTYENSTDGPTHAASRQALLRPDTPAVTRPSSKGRRPSFLAAEQNRKRTRTSSTGQRSTSPAVRKLSLETGGEQRFLYTTSKSPAVQPPRSPSPVRSPTESPVVREPAVSRVRSSFSVTENEDNSGRVDVEGSKSISPRLASPSARRPSTPLTLKRSSSSSSAPRSKSLCRTSPPSAIRHASVEKERSVKEQKAKTSLSSSVLKKRKKELDHLKDWSMAALREYANEHSISLSGARSKDAVVKAIEKATKKKKA